MAIDLCNKLPGALSQHDAAAWARAVDGSVLLEDLGSEQRAALNFAYRTTVSNVDPRFVAGDPAAWSSDFGYALDRVAIRLDNRTNDELREHALSHPDPAMREQALFEYADRDHDDAVELLCEAVRRDPNRELRWDALWAVEKLGGAPAVTALREFVADDDPEIAEWARLFASELRTGDPAFDGRSGRYTPGRTFDETIYLLIHCDLYVRLDLSNTHWGKISLAPQSLARIYGQAHACPNAATRERQLVIAKTISGLHEDGSPHCDNYLFRGFTDRTRRDRGNFFFESLVPRTFFRSGRADDPSEGVRQANIGFARYGTWHLEPRFQVHGEPAIRYVRGRFQGWGYLNLSRIAGRPLEEILTPGNGVLSTLHDSEVGPMTNAFILGTFKGKLNDWDGDGVVDLNSRDVYSTVDGEIDSDQDGIPDEPAVPAATTRTCCPDRPHSTYVRQRMTSTPTQPSVKFGRPVETDGVPDIYAGALVIPWTAPDPGIDNLGISSVDTFAVPGVGEYTVAFDGYVRVVRSEPTSREWSKAEVYTNLIEMKMVGSSAELGTIVVHLNPDCLSTGQIRTPFDPYAGEGPSAKACRMAVGAVFEMPKLGLRLINKEPIILTIDDVRQIPPAGSPGKGQIYRMLPLHDVENPDGEPIAYVTSLRFTMGGYLTAEEIAAS